MERRWALPVALAVAVILMGMVVPAILGPAGGWSGWHPWMGWGFGWMWFMPVFMIAFWGLVIWAVVAAVQGGSPTSGSRPGRPSEESALEILKRRYAQGEIGKEEYEEKKRDLF